MCYFLESINPMIRQKLPDIRLDIVGGGVTEKLRSLASADKSIRLLGYVDDPLPYIQKASVFIVPLRSGSGTRLKILGAISAGKAIVTTSIGCEGIVGDNGKHFIVADNPYECSDSVVKVINNPIMREALGSNARALVTSNYNWKTITDGLNKIYARFFAICANN